MRPHDVRALTVRQPYAAAILLGQKTIETRKTRISNGEIVICAGAIEASPLSEVCTELLRRGVKHADLGAALELRRKAIAICRIARVRPHTPADFERSLVWSEDVWAHELEDLRAIEPFTVRGLPGLFGVPRAAIKVVGGQR